MSNSLGPHRLYGSWNSPGQNTGVGSLSLLQGIFPTQGWNPGLSHCRQTLYQEATLDRLEEAVQARLEAQLDVFRGYGVDQAQLLEDAAVLRRGSYLFYAVDANADQWEDAFLSCIR